MRSGNAGGPDPAAPVQTFVIGVPGADTYDSSGCNAPPYHMRLALSAFAKGFQALGEQAYLDAGRPAKATAACPETSPPRVKDPFWPMALPIMGPMI